MNVSKRVSRFLALHCAKTFRTPKTFTFQGRKYRYFYHKYNRTWMNGRAVEIPVLWDFVKRCEGSVLELGNVLSHYFAVKHDILDKYEQSEGVINEDVVDFRPQKQYDLIISISTLEHIGWDETPRELTKVIRAVDNLISLLAPEGQFIATVPIGYNPELDRLLREGKVKYTKRDFMKQVSKKNIWAEARWGEVCNARFNEYPNALDFITFVNCAEMPSCGSGAR